MHKEGKAYHGIRYRRRRTGAEENWAAARIENGVEAWICAHVSGLLGADPCWRVGDGEKHWSGSVRQQHPWSYAAVAPGSGEFCLILFAGDSVAFRALCTLCIVPVLRVGLRF